MTITVFIWMHSSVKTIRMLGKRRLVTLDRKSVQQEWTEVFNTSYAQKEAENLHQIIEILLNERCPQRVVKTN